MTGTGTILISGTLTGFDTGTRTLSIANVIPTAIDGGTGIILQSGYNAISVPSGATVCVIKPPQNNTVALLLKGDTADVGISIHKTYGIQLTLDGETIIGITATSVTTGVTQFEFF